MCRCVCVCSRVRVIFHRNCIVVKHSEVLGTKYLQQQTLNGIKSGDLVFFSKTSKKRAKPMAVLCFVHMASYNFLKQESVHITYTVQLFKTRIKTMYRQLFQISSRDIKFYLPFSFPSKVSNYNEKKTKSMISY